MLAISHACMDAQFGLAVPLPRFRMAEPVHAPTESELVARLRARDETAFVELINRYHGQLLRLAGTFVASSNVAEEVVQDTWVAVLDGLDTFEERSSLKTWIFRILSNRAKTRGVREKRSIPFSSFHEGASNDEPAVDPAQFAADGHWASAIRPWNEDTPDKLLSTHESVARLQVAIESLPPNQRAVVTLRDVEGLESEAVCAILEISEANQRVLLHRARTYLRTVLDEYVDRR